MAQFGWNKHDGVNFGVQTIIDTAVNVTTSFVKQPGGVNGGDWTNRIKVEPLRKQVRQLRLSDSGQLMKVTWQTYSGAKNPTTPKQSKEQTQEKRSVRHT